MFFWKRTQSWIESGAYQHSRSYLRHFRSRSSDRSLPVFVSIQKKTSHFTGLLNLFSTGINACNENDIHNSQKNEMKFMEITTAQTFLQMLILFRVDYWSLRFLRNLIVGVIFYLMHMLNGSLSEASWCVFRRFIRP